MTSIPCQAFTSKLPKMAQPDLDFTAPEVQSVSSCSAMSDMFSLGLLIASLYNNGRSLIESNLNTSHYCKQLDSRRSQGKGVAYFTWTNIENEGVFYIERGGNDFVGYINWIIIYMNFLIPYPITYKTHFRDS
ncbi:unnamed protein product [Medioppia subpectinata]|uniref:Uncharacterized protein n=1 Tax=Medioppia subpectinata TaxID=1979941 RepID=A0A7R9KCW1_9ACAR|nr:unnamed protein product [Medioppia subpectinata]CAG2100885.1 unnamed protein product [Medioppia subpectinata]